MEKYFFDYFLKSNFFWGKRILNLQRIVKFEVCVDIDIRRLEMLLQFD